MAIFTLVLAIAIATNVAFLACYELFAWQSGLCPTISRCIWTSAKRHRAWAWLVVGLIWTMLIFAGVRLTLHFLYEI